MNGAGWAKLGRAKEHLQALNKEVNRFLNKDPYPVTHTHDNGRHTFTVRIRADAPIGRWALLVGDMVHNLRAALDHVAWDLAERTAGLQPDDRSTQFPIYGDKAAFETHGRRMMARLPPEAREAIAEIQPFNRKEGEAAETRPLWVIAALDNHDKHKVLVAGFAIGDESDIEYTVPPWTSAKFDKHLRLGAFEDGTEIAHVTLTPANSKIKVRGRFTFDLGFGLGLGQPLHLRKIHLPAMVACVEHVLGLEVFT